MLISLVVEMLIQTLYTMRREAFLEIPEAGSKFEHRKQRHDALRMSFLGPQLKVI